MCSIRTDLCENGYSTIRVNRMSNLLLVRDIKFQQHLTPELHPESPQRLAAIDTAFHKSSVEHHIEEMAPRFAGEDEIATVHNPAYIEDLHNGALKVKKGEFVQLDADTFMSPDTFDTAKLAAGAGLTAVDAVADGGFQSSFVAVRTAWASCTVCCTNGFLPVQ